ncbi:MAG: hypothetical protein WDN45_13700 [Caulobacteraceae bacterium]
MGRSALGLLSRLLRPAPGAHPLHHRPRSGRTSRNPRRTTAKRTSPPACAPGATVSRRVLRDTGDRVLAADVHARYAEAFPPGYQDLFGAREALADLETIETLGLDRPVAVRAYRAADDPEDGFRFKLYRRETAAPLSDMLPIVESMGLRALVEHGFELKPAGEPSVWVHELILRRGARSVSTSNT